MTNVFIPSFLFKNVKVKTKEEGEWVKGEYIEGSLCEKIISAVYMPVSSSDLKNYPEGVITLEDIDLRTKEDLKLGDIVEIDGKDYEIIQKTDFSYIADLKFYILKRSDKDD